MLVVIAFAYCHDRILPIRPQLEPDVFLTFLSGARFSQRDEQAAVGVEADGRDAASMRSLA